MPFRTRGRGSRAVENEYRELYEYSEFLWKFRDLASKERILRELASV